MARHGDARLFRSRRDSAAACLVSTHRPREWYVFIASSESRQPLSYTIYLSLPDNSFIVHLLFHLMRRRPPMLGVADSFPSGGCERNSYRR